DVVQHGSLLSRDQASPPAVNVQQGDLVFYPPSHARQNLLVCREMAGLCQQLFRRSSLHLLQMLGEGGTLSGGGGDPRRGLLLCPAQRPLLALDNAPAFHLRDQTLIARSEASGIRSRLGGGGGVHHAVVIGHHLANASLGVASSAQ